KHFWDHPDFLVVKQNLVELKRSLVEYSEFQPDSAEPECTQRANHRVAMLYSEQRILLGMSEW
ncbi:hypothetical protein A2U01_0099629, partial [Trifolium medium]|nr:hypothetical protein [Trifolium medium]